MVEPGPRPGRDIGHLLIRGAALLAILVALAVRVRLLSVPFERDEGEFAYAGRLILQGIPPYRLVYNMKLPGTYAAYALIMALFGRTVVGVHLGLLLVNGATIAVLFLLARRLFGGYAATVAAGSYALLSVGPSVLGMFTHATHFVVLPALGGLLLLLKALESPRPRRFFAAGFLLGLAFVMKQHGIFFVAFGGCYFLWARLRRWWEAPDVPGLRRRLLTEGALLALGAALPFALTCLILRAAGVFERFWFWTFDYARLYVNEVPFAAVPHDLPIMMAIVSGPMILIWVVALVGTTALYWDRETKGRRFFTAGLLLFSFLSVFPGYFFRPHYFVMLLPAVALLAGVGIDSLRRLLSRTPLAEVAAALPGLLFLGVVLASIYPQAPFFFGMTPQQVSRQIYGPNPFPEAVEVARYVASHSSPEDRVAVLGSEPEIFFYADRKSATGYIYMYGLMEPQPYALTMQREAIREIEASAPLYLVYVDVEQSWLERDYSQPLLKSWYKKYVADRFEQVGLVEILSDAETDYSWDRKFTGQSARSPYSIAVYRRKSR